MTSLAVTTAAVFVAMTLAAGALVSLAARFVRRAAWTRASTPWALSIVLPLVVGLLGCVALVLPTSLTGCHCLTHAHHPHVCLAHAALAEPLLMPALALLGVWFVFALPGAIRLTLALLESSGRIRQVRRITPERIGEIDVRFVDSGMPTAFTAGALSPVIVFDRALWAALGERDRDVVLQHERGHVERGDPLTSLVLRGCLALQPWLPRSLFSRWKHAAELHCDRHAAERIGDASAAAEALVSVGRLRITPPRPDEALLGVFGAEGIEDRVSALLDDERGARASRRNDVIAILVPALGALALVLVWPGDLLHHAVESVIGLLHR